MRSTLSCDLWGCGLIISTRYFGFICALLCLKVSNVPRVVECRDIDPSTLRVTCGMLQRRRAPVPALLQPAPVGRFDDDIFDVAQDGHEVRAAHRLLQHRVKVFPLVLEHTETFPLLINQLLRCCCAGSCDCTSVIRISCFVLMPLLGATMSRYITIFLRVPPFIMIWGS